MGCSSADNLVTTLQELEVKKEEISASETIFPSRDRSNVRKSTSPNEKKGVTSIYTVRYCTIAFGQSHTHQIVTSSINASSPLLSGMIALIEEVKGERSER